MSKNIMAAITILARGYDVQIIINGSDIGVTGGKTESLRLFSENHTMVPDLPEDMKQLVCLKKGENRMSLKFKRLEDDDSSKLTVELKSKEQFVNDEFLVCINEEMDVGRENSIEKTFIL